MARNPRRRPRKGELPSNVVRHRGKVMVDGASHVSETFATPELAAEWVKDLRAADAATERGEPLTLKGATKGQKHDDTTKVRTIKLPPHAEPNGWTLEPYRGGWDRIVQALQA